jgi:hypothetical protein
MTSSNPLSASGGEILQRDLADLCRIGLGGSACSAVRSRATRSFFITSSTLCVRHV